ncbi:DNA-3-methyladenine glycosylase I [bacterium]|nr:DNA-3-methyladenine glycosylase I [bacterium]MCI0613215.1 DNA-3-methyladenine glycosylase I [bacterium]
MKKLENTKRCAWPATDPLMIEYHDAEWGVPLHNDRKIFEFLVLEGMQAGLSWLTILRKRENYRQACHQFDPDRIAKYGTKDVARLMKNAGIIRNRLKIEAMITNARKFLEVQKEFGTFDKYIWQFVNGGPIQNRLRNLSQIVATSKESDELSKDLKQRGFKFVGSTIVYAHMQATGMVNDHVVDCFRYKQLTKKS